MSQRHWSGRASSVEFQAELRIREWQRKQQAVQAAAQATAQPQNPKK